MPNDVEDDNDTCDEGDSDLEDDTTFDDDDDGNLEFFTELKQSLSIAIAQYYQLALNSPSPSKWLGRHGKISKICDTFQIKSQTRRMMRRIIG